MYGRAFFGGRYYGPRYWGDGGSGEPVDTGQSPRATRNRAGYRANWVYRSVWWIVVSTGVMG